MSPTQWWSFCLDSICLYLQPSLVIFTGSCRATQYHHYANVMCSTIIRSCECWSGSYTNGTISWNHNTRTSYVPYSGQRGPFTSAKMNELEWFGDFWIPRDSLQPSISRKTPQVNSLAPGRCGFNVKFVILKLILRIDILSISSELI